MTYNDSDYMETGGKFSAKYLLRLQGLGGWEIRKKSYANSTVFSSMTVLSRDLAFDFFNKVENKKVRQCAQSQGKKRTFGDSY